MFVQEQLLLKIKQTEKRGVPELSDNADNTYNNSEFNRLKIQLIQTEKKIGNFIKQIGEANNIVMEYINRIVSELDGEKKDIIAKIVKLNNYNDNEKLNYGGTDLYNYIKNWEIPDIYDMDERKMIAGTFIKKVEITDDFINIKFY